MEESGESRTVRFAVIGDIHAHERHLAAVMDRLAREGAGRLDAILLVGDVGAGGHRLRILGRADLLYMKSLERVFAVVRALGPPVFWVPGNHDLPEAPGEGNLDGTSTVVNGVRIAGIGGAGPGRFGFAYEWDEEQIRARSVPPCDVLLCHTPPHGTDLDRIPSGKHVGSRALRERALAHSGAYVCGHIHEAPGAVVLGKCLCLNVGGLGAPYGLPQVGFLERSPFIPGGWRAEHEDLSSGRTRSWTLV
ncbi:MAG: metallophosphoesterase [Planctomycetes bacterium]|nr:metallophosphoesterase [Planctomycetota bacterium]